ncbi:MAG: hypothetical protein ACXABO_21490 [Promethearchaeota archaeon]
MTVRFHFRVPFIPSIILLISLITYLIAIISLKKDEKLKTANLLIIGVAIAILWYIIDFFIPGILLPLVPTAADLEFTRIYGTILAGLLPDIVLILSLGVMPLVVFFMNRSSNSILYLALGAIIQIISILIGIDQYDLLISVISLIITVISMAFFAYYAYKIKNFFLILFSLSFLIARILYLLMI